MDGNFSGFLWSPYIKNWNGIINDISLKKNITHYKIIDFNKNKHLFEKSILEIYSTDDVSLKKVKDIKLKSFLKHDYTYNYFSFNNKNPDYRKKKKFNTKISKATEQIKKFIRNKYKDDKYIFDNMIHITDNTEQHLQILKIMDRYVDNYCKNTMYSLKFVLKKLYLNDVFKRVDILVRKHSIEQYLNDSSYDFSLYKKMQYRRVGKKRAKSHIEKFKTLINKMNDEGFIKDFPIKLNSHQKWKHHLVDGSHRISWAYLNNEKFIPIIYKKRNDIRDYSINWFKDNNFNKKEIDIIENELKILKNYLNN